MLRIGQRNFQKLFRILRTKKIKAERILLFSVAAAVVLLGGCATESVLVSPKDETFREARQNFESTVSLVDKYHAPSHERALFLQGEAFYDYRFKSQPRNFRLFVSEGLAVATDFPAFLSLSGNFDLVNLRLRSSDAAVQMWETLLLENPKTILRPLVLYRLGWAYRYTGVEGLPRSEPDEPFDVLIKEDTDPNLTQLSKEAKLVPWKSKDKAAAWASFPGLGQFYLGHNRSGALRLGVGLAAVTAIVIPVYNTLTSPRGFSLKHDWPQTLLGLTGLLVLSFDYSSSYEDAMRGVVEYNEEGESQFKGTHPDAP